MFASGSKVGPYEVQALLGEGGMGQVYRGRDPRLGRDVAIKVLAKDALQDAEASGRLEREARAIAALSHPNIVAVYDVGREDSTFFLVTELLEGKTLRAALNAPMSWRRAVEIGAEVSEGLAAAHAKSIVHRDLKPENIFLTDSGRVKILDFGLAQTDPVLNERDEGEIPTTKWFQTQPGTVIGTLGYMSPEQLRGEAVDPSADLFSLGCILFEMVTLKKPFHRESGAATIAAILKDELPRDLLGSVVPSEFQRIIEGCVEKSPATRFQSARDLALTLRAIGSSASVVNDSLIRTITKRRTSKTIDSIAVLPFVHASDDPNTEYLSDGITEGIINKLSQLPKLKVMARSTVFRYKGREVDPQNVGRELRVRAVLTGVVKNVGERLQISVELVDSFDGAQLWGDTYSRELADLLKLQAEMSREIADTLRPRLTGAEKKKLRKRTTENSEAYQLYLKGRYHWNKRTEDGLRKGVQFFREAIESDPSFAMAYAGMADCFITMTTNIPLPPRDTMPKAKAAALRAIEIDSGLAEAWASLGAVRWWFDWDWEGAEEAYRRSIELNPNYANAHDGYAMLLSARGRFDQAVEQISRASELDPLALIIAVHAGWPFYFARDFESAIRRFRKALELDENFIPAHGWLGMALGQQHRHAEALDVFERALEVDRIPILTTMLAHTHAIAGNRDRAHELLGELRATARDRYISPYDIAIIHAALGDTRAALVQLQAALDDRSPWMVFLRVDPRLDPLRNEPGFAEILAALH